MGNLSLNNVDNTNTNTADLNVIVEEPAFSLHGGSGWGEGSEDVNVSWADLKAAPVGTTWAANNISGCIRASIEETAEVVYRSVPEEGAAVVVTVLFRQWSAGNSPEAEVEEETPRLVAFRCQ